MIDIMTGNDTDVVSSSNIKKGSKAGVVVAFVCLVALAAGGAYWMQSHSKPAGVVDPQDSVDAVRAADAQWSKAAAANDIERTIAFYSDDALVMPPNGVMAKDKGAERKAWSEILAPGTNLSWTAGKIVSSKGGDMVYDVGIYTLITTLATFAGPSSILPSPWTSNVPLGDPWYVSEVIHCTTASCKPF